MVAFESMKSMASKKKYDCCQCNDKGLCLHCSCAKLGNPCTNCLPLRRGHCNNARFDLLHATVPKPVIHADQSDQSGSISSPLHPTMTMTLMTSSEDSVPTSQQLLKRNINQLPTSSSQGASSSPIDSVHVVGAPSCLPDPIPAVIAIFEWGTHSSDAACKILLDIYAEIVHWRKNFFPVPSGSCGKSFVSELARLFRAFAENSALESIALKAVTVLCILLVQKPHPRSKICEHSSCLPRRLDLWHEGKFEDLLAEGRVIQQMLYSQRRKSPESSQLVRSFTNLMFKGKTRAAIRLLTDNDRGQVLQLNDSISPGSTDSPTVLDILRSKHPPSQPHTMDLLMSPGLDPPTVHPIIYKRIDARCIRTATLHTFGAEVTRALMLIVGGGYALHLRDHLMTCVILSLRLLRNSARCWLTPFVCHHFWPVILSP